MERTISSTSNAVVKDAVRLHRSRRRRETGRILVEGPTVFDAALSAGLEPEIVFVLEADTDTRDLGRQRGWDVVVVPEHVLEHVADADHPRSPVAVFEMPEPSEVDEGDVVVLVDLADPGNVGTIIRTAAALGWQAAVTVGCADPWGPKALRAGAGAQFLIGVGQVDRTAIGELTHVTVATVVDGGASDAPAGPGRALLIGSEAHGLPDHVA
ncbi:MAG: RNA methyltransferase, partial [Acidimicrobiia bacterium]|nr:RNA methyltransferase [Acidimicrobiia bacterium]